MNTSLWGGDRLNVRYRLALKSLLTSVRSRAFKTDSVERFCSIGYLINMAPLPLSPLHLIVESTMWTLFAGLTFGHATGFL